MSATDGEDEPHCTEAACRVCYPGPAPGFLILVCLVVVFIGAGVMRACVKQEPVRTYTSSCDYTGSR